MYFSMHQLVEKADMVMTVINSIMTIGSGDYIYMCEGIWCSSFSVKELDVTVHKNYFLI